jgi:ABC-type branched-subunit amino acid transport system substrate-binding protein
MASPVVRVLRGAQWVVCLAAVVSACSPRLTPPPEPPKSVRRGDQAFRYEEYEGAIDAYRSYVEQVDKDAYTPRVFYKMALAQYRLGRYADAVATLDALAERYPNTHWVQVEALRGDCERALGRPLAAVRSWDRAWTGASDSDRPKLRQRVVSAARDLSDADLKRADEAVDSKEVKKLLDRQLAMRQVPFIGDVTEEPGGAPSDGRTAAAQRGQSLDLTEESERPADIETVGSSAAPPPEPQEDIPTVIEGAGGTQIQTGHIAEERPAETAGLQTPPTEAGDLQASAPESAEEPIDEGFTEEPATEPAPAAIPVERRAVEERAHEETIRGPVKIGCLLPLSGSAREFGQRSLRGLKLIFGEDNDRLIVKDTASNEATALQMFQELSQNPNVLVVIGPLRSEEAKAVAPIAEQAEVPLLLLSQQDGLSGRFVLQAGMTRSSQVDTLLDYAMDRVRLRRFGVLYPSDTYGEEFLSAFKAEVVRRGGTVVGVDAYAPGAPAVVAADIKRWRKHENLQAVFVPDDAAAGAEVARFLQQQMPDVTLLGVHGWQRLLQQSDTTALNGVLFADGFYVGSTRPATRDFVDRFRRTYRELPGVLEAQAYDAASLAARALEGGARSRLSLLNGMLDLGRVVGATGELAITPQGVQHKLFLLQVYDGKLQEIRHAG